MKGSARPKGDLMEHERLEMQKNMQRFGLCAVIIVSLYTFRFACKGSLITSNISQVGNMPGNYGGFILWGVVCATLFYGFFTALFSLLDCQSRHLKRLFISACTLFLLTVLLPFRPDQYPTAASLHNEFAKTATILTAIVTLLLSIQTKRLNKAVYHKALLMWVCNTAVCMYLVARTGISGLVEAVFIATTCLHLFCIMRWTLQAKRSAPTEQGTGQYELGGMTAHEI